MTAGYIITPGTILENFETIGDWTISGGTAAVDTSIFKTGAGSLKLTSGSGTNCIATKTINLDLSRGGRIGFWIYVDGSVDDIASIQVILSESTTFASFFTKSFSGTLHEGWNRMLIGRDQWTESGTPSWANPMVRLRVRVNANASVAPVVYYDSMDYGEVSRPKAIISFDDGWDSQITEGYDYMRRFGMPGSLYLIKQRIDTSGYMTTAQVQTLFDAGWDVMNHTVNHLNMETQYTLQAEVEGELAGCRDWIREKGWSRLNGENHVAYPNGGYDSKVLAAMDALDMVTGRTIINRSQANVIDHQYLLTRQSHAYTASQATYESYINRAISDGGSVEINYHKIVADGTGAVDTEVEQSQFRGLINYLQSRRPQIDVVTKLEWYRGLTDARRLA